MQLRTTLAVAAAVLATAFTQTAQAAQPQSDNAKPTTSKIVEKVQGTKNQQKGGCNFQLGMEGTNNGSQSIWRVDFSWDDPALVAELGVDPVVNRDLYNKLMEKPREENQAKCVGFLKKELTQNPTTPEKADYPKSDSAWEGAIDKFPFLNPALTSFSNGTVRPRTVFPVQRGNPNRVFTTTWHEGVVWAHTWFTDPWPFQLKTTEVTTWEDWWWNEYGDCCGSGGDYRWWRSETGWREVVHQLDSYVVGNVGMNAKTWDYFDNRFFCDPASEYDPTRTFFNDSHVVGGTNGQWWWWSNWYWDGACWSWLTPHAEGGYYGKS